MMMMKMIMMLELHMLKALIRVMEGNDENVCHGVCTLN